jgi:ketosteroid isomerase-like protein
MNSATNIEVTRRLFAAFGAGDVPAILDLLDDEVLIEFYGPPAIPYAGTYRGRAEARRFFETVLASVDIHRFEPEEFLADADKVVVTGCLRLSARSTGREIESDFVHVITVRNGRWLRFRDFMNTAVAAAAFGE